MADLNKHDWFEMGIRLGYCGPPVCSTHDGVPTSNDEDREFDDGYDPCIPIVRVYSDSDEQKAVEEAHSPSRWRKLYQ